jgi:hypothetical protein
MPSCGAALRPDNPIGRLIRKHRRTARLLDNKAARERNPTKTMIERQEMLLADPQRERDLVVVMQGGGGSAQASRRIAAALGPRVGFHAPDTTNLCGRTVQGSHADHDADM